ncbi:MAG: HD domain-containing protein [Methanocorpusculum sp.]|nr:HD domain-containing protein [Methanocorpusculum sp.]
MPKQIKDPVHGYIEVKSEILPLLDSEKLQRLHHIRQLGFIYLVYPGANHTRYEHSLGAMHLASLLCRNLELSRDESLLVESAALLHDIGHGPYSHTSERLCKEFHEFSHDEILPHLSDDEIAPVLEENGTDPKEISEIVSGHHRLASIIHGDLDVDRMDYLLRDAHYTGVPYGTFDAGRLIQSLVFTKFGLAVKENGISAAESLLIARTLMGPSVYHHHVSRIAEEMFMIAGRNHVDSSSVDRFMKMDDVQATAELMNSSSQISRKMINGIRTRRLYKRAVYAGSDSVDAARMASLSKDAKERLRRAIIETAGVLENDVILDIPPLRKEMKMQVQVKNHHDLIPLDEIFPLMSTMNEARHGQWMIGVYCPKELRERVSAAAVEVLNVRRATKQTGLEIY